MLNGRDVKTVDVIGYSEMDEILLVAARHLFRRNLVILPNIARVHRGSKMAVSGPGSVKSGDTLTNLDDSLLSLEKLDRASPELWPEQIPGVSEYVSLHPSTPNISPQPWTKGLDADDINLLHQFGSLTAAGLIAEVKKLHDVAYQLGLEEAKEMTRGKYLNILTRRRR